MHLLRSRTHAWQRREAWRRPRRRGSWTRKSRRAHLLVCFVSFLQLDDWTIGGFLLYPARETDSSSLTRAREIVRIVQSSERRRILRPPPRTIPDDWTIAMTRRHRLV